MTIYQYGIKTIHIFAMVIVLCQILLGRALQTGYICIMRRSTFINIYYLECCFWRAKAWYALTLTLFIPMLYWENTPLFPITFHVFCSAASEEISKFCSRMKSFDWPWLDVIILEKVSSKREQLPEQITMYRIFYPCLPKVWLLWGLLVFIPWK